MHPKTKIKSLLPFYFPKIGIQGKLTTIFILLSTFPLLLLGAFIVNEQIRIRQEENLRNMESEIKGLKSRTTLFLTRVESEITLLMKSTEMKKVLSSLGSGSAPGSETLLNAEKEFLNIVTDNNFYLKASLLNNRGKEVISVINDRNSPAILTKDQLSKIPKNYYAHVVAEMGVGEIFLSPAEIKSPVENKFTPIIDFILPVYDHENKVTAIVTINIRAEKLFDLLVPMYNIQTKKIFIVNGEGYYIFHSEKKNQWNELFTNKSDENIFKEYSNDIAMAILGDKPNSTLYDRGRIIQFSPIFSGSKATTDKYFIVEDVSASAVMPSLGQLKLLLISLIIFAGIVSLILGFWTARKFLHPIKQLIKGTKIIRSGNLDYKLEISTSDEVQDLINNFNQLVLEWKNKQLLEKENRKLSQSVQQSPISIIITDPEFIIEYINPKVSELTGCSINEIKSSPIPVFRNGFLPENFDIYIIKTLNSGGNWAGEIRNLSLNGELVWEFATISPIYDENGRIMNFLIIKEDITARKNMIEELIIAKEKAESVGRLKSEFLSLMSHEIRTPLNIIIGAATILEDELITKADTMLLGFFHSLKSGSDRIVRTIESILLISDLKSGTYSPDFAVLDLQAAIATLIRQTGEKLSKQSNLPFEFLIIPGHIYVRAEEFSLKLIMTNLIDNAFKYTRQGKINVSITKDGTTVAIKVEDTGIGMTDEFLGNMFNPFTQEDQSITRPFDGNGLGLALIHGFCELNSISLKVESTKNTGSSFTLFMNEIES